MSGAPGPDAAGQAQTPPLGTSARDADGASAHGAREELARLSRLAWPIVLTQVALMGLGVVDYMMVGRSSVIDVGAVSLGNAWKVGTLLAAMGVVFGIAPIVSQAHGARRPQEAGRALQRGALLGVVLAAPIALLWWHAERALLAFGQEPEIARVAARYVRVQIPSLPFFLVWVAQREYLQGRGVLAPTLWIALFANLANALLNWILIFGHGGVPALGAVGAGISTCALQAALPLATGWWMARSQRLADARVPWDGAVWNGPELRRILRLGAPIALALLFEMWAFQIMTLWSGRLSRDALAAHSLVLNLASLSFMLPLGISLASVTRVGNLIGAGEPRQARRSAWLALAVGGGAMGVCAVLFLLGRQVLPRVYTPDSTVIALAAGTLPVAAAFQLFDGLQVVGGGVLRGAGQTRPAAVFHLFGFYGLGLPLAHHLCFARGMGLAGLWWGIALGLAAVAVLLVAWIALRGPGSARTRQLPCSAHGSK